MAVGSKKKKLSYRDLVTTSDEAFALTVIEHHKEKWTTSNQDDKKRVTGKEKGEAIAYYKSTTKSLKEYRDKFGEEKYAAGEEWYDKKKQNMTGKDGGSSTGAKDDDDDDDDSDNEQVEIEMNPYLQDITAEEEV